MLASISWLLLASFLMADTNIQWLVSGDGTIRSLDHGTRFAFSKIIPGSKRPVDITRSSSSTNWIIVAAFQNKFVF